LTIRESIASDPVLGQLFEEVRQRFDSDAAHDIGHLLRVAHWTVRLCADEAPRVSVAAALLHDIVNVPKNHVDRATASERSAEVARSLLPSLGFDDRATELIAEAVLDHSYSRGVVPRSSLGKALQDADRLEAVGVIGTFRCIATGVRFGAQFFDDDDPWARRRALDDRRFSVDHFFTKLLALPATFQTVEGRAEADRRVKIMYSILEALEGELS
jgi:uncharacterized protein